VNTEIPPNARNDELLVIRCQLGERDAFEILITRWHEPIWRYLRRLADSDHTASDMAQDTWVKVMRSIANLNEPASLRPWLFGIARRVAMDRLRRKYADLTEPDTALEELAATEPEPDLSFELAAMESKIDSLPLRERETLTLFYLRELRIEEIATLLGVPAGTVKSRLHRARRQLRNTLIGDNS